MYLLTFTPPWCGQAAVEPTDEIIFAVNFCNCSSPARGRDTMCVPYSELTLHTPSAACQLASLLAFTFHIILYHLHCSCFCLFLHIFISPLRFALSPRPLGATLWRQNPRNCSSCRFQRNGLLTFKCVFLSTARAMNMSTCIQIGVCVYSCECRNEHLFVLF